MVTYLDTQTGGLNNDLTQGGTFQWNLNLGTKFWLNVANNVITGQASGQAVTFKVWDIRGSSEVTVPYGKYVSRPVTGHLVTTVPATLPSTPNADVHIILDDDAVPIQVQFVGTGTSGGTVPVELSVAFAGNVLKNVYTPPVGQKLSLISVYVSSSSTDLNLAVLRAGAGSFQDNIFITKVGPVTVGLGPANTVQIPPGFYIFPGDILQILDAEISGPGGVISLTGLLEPL